MKDTAILPPAMLGIIGGGQLGRMFTIAAKTMGYKVTVLDPDPYAPAAEYADQHLCAAFNDPEALNILAACDAVTIEFENVDAQAMLELAKFTRVSPSGECVAIAQNRIQEKNWIAQAGLTTAPYATILSEKDCQQNLEALFPAILKTATLGYDGKGQIRLHHPSELIDAFKELKQVPCVLEKMLTLKAEISVVLTRVEHHPVQCFPVAENQHRNSILDVSIVPARITEELQKQAQKMAIRLADELNYIGVMAVEFFVCSDNQLIVNEIAPRPHNSGHYTLDACLTDQFQQQVRALCMLPPACTALQSACTMVNILGDRWKLDSQEAPDWYSVLRHPDAYLHLYGKKEARAGRKMGHYTVLAEQSEQALEKAQSIQQQLNHSF